MSSRSCGLKLINLLAAMLFPLPAFQAPFQISASRRALSASDATVAFLILALFHRALALVVAPWSELGLSALMICFGDSRFWHENISRTVSVAASCPLLIFLCGPD